VVSEDAGVPPAPSTRRSSRPRAVPDDPPSGVDDLIAGTRPLTARSVLASVLLGAPEPELPVAALVEAAALFGISSGAARTCLWRMVSDGELTTDNAAYALAGHLLERRFRVDDAARPEQAQPRPWAGTWEVAVVSAERRPAADRLALRRAATALHLAEIREGVWTRPDNLDATRLPASRAVLDRQCVQFRGASGDLGADAARSLFALDTWANDARRLTIAMAGELAIEPRDGDSRNEALTHQFMLAIAAVRHLQADPLLPVALLPEDWPAPDLRTTYRDLNRAFHRQLTRTLR
jgi:phenylacetic acid degradation operon negative regulatory protein